MNRCVSRSFVVAIGVIALLAAPQVMAQNADITTELVGPTSVEGGTTATYSCTYTNLGPQNIGDGTFINVYIPAGYPASPDQIFLQPSGEWYDNMQASAEGTDTPLGNAPLLFFDDSTCQGMLFQVQRDDDDQAADGIEGLQPSVSSTWSFDLELPMDPFPVGKIVITSPPEFAQEYTLATTTYNTLYDAATDHRMGAGAACDGPDSDGDGAGDIPFCEDLSQCLGDPLWAVPMFEGELEVVDDGNASGVGGIRNLCEPIDATFTPGNIAFGERGECYFSDKVLNAQLAGATALVIMNDGRCSSLPGNDTCVLNMADGTGVAPLVTIPFTLLPIAEAQPIIDFLVGGGTVTATVGAHPSDTFQLDSTGFHSDSTLDPDLTNDDFYLEVTYGGAVPQPPVASFSFMADGLTVTFTDTSTNNPTSWLWDFGDGKSTSTDQNPVYTYAADGTYEVSLTATNAQGSDTTSVDLPVTGGTTPMPPVASFSFTTNGLTVTFTDTSTNDPTSWLWDFGDAKTTSTDQNPVFTYAADGTYTVSLTATNDQGSDTASQDVTVSGSTQPLDMLYFIPAAAIASGAQGSFFQTDVDVNNTAPPASQMSVNYQFLWLPRGEDNSTPTASEVFTLGPGMSVRYENVLNSVFGAEPNALGALAIATDSMYLIAMSRTYNLPAGKVAGTFGQALPAVPFAELIATGETQRIIFMSENADIRANLGCVNGVSSPITIDITEYDATGAVLEAQTMDLAPWSNNQINQIFGAFAPVNGYVDVSTATADAAFYCYGSVLDNLTSDPTSVLPQSASDSVLNFVAAAALAGGAEGSFFQTDVDLNNAGSMMSTYSFLWLPRGEDNSSPTASDSFTLGAGMGVRYENVLSEVFGAEPNALGALALSSDGGNVLVMTRTYNIPSVKVAGTFGQALEGIPADRLLMTGETGRIIFLSENDDIRSNVGCVNGIGTPITIDITEYDAAGELLETRTMDLAGWSNNQINRIFEAFAPVDGYVDVSSATAGAAFYCYGSVLDNDTSDPTTIPPQ